MAQYSTHWVLTNENEQGDIILKRKVGDGMYTRKYMKRTIHLMPFYHFGTQYFKTFY